LFEGIMNRGLMVYSQSGVIDYEKLNIHMAGRLDELIDSDLTRDETAAYFSIKLPDSKKYSEMPKSSIGKQVLFLKKKTVTGYAVPKEVDLNEILWDQQVTEPEKMILTLEEFTVLPKEERLQYNLDYEHYLKSLEGSALSNIFRPLFESTNMRLGEDFNGSHAWKALTNRWLITREHVPLYTHYKRSLLVVSSEPVQALA
jgi:hypothetical protein